MKLKAALPRPDGDAAVSHGVEQLKQALFAPRRIAGLDIGDEHGEARRGELLKSAHGPLEALTAFVRRDLLVVVGVEEPQDKHAPAPGGEDEAGELGGDGRFRLKGRERPRDLRPVEHRPRRKPERDRNPRKRVAVELHRAIDHRERLPRRAAEGKADGIDAGMPVEQAEARRGLQGEAGNGLLESRDEGQGVGIDAAKVHGGIARVMAVAQQEDTTNLSYCQE